MTDNKEKSLRECNVFLKFITRSGLPIDPDSMEKHHPPEPDILCRLGTGDPVAFELVEMCDNKIAETVSILGKNSDADPLYLRTVDPTDGILKNKRAKQYQTNHPIELLCYTDGRTVTPPDQIISKIRLYYDNDDHQFRRVWFMGQEDETCECVCQKSDPIQGNRGVSANGFM